MAAHREPIEIDPNTPIGEAIEHAIDTNGEARLRVGSHLLLVHRSDFASPDPPTTGAPGSIDRIIAAAQAGKDSIDAEAMKRFIYEMRDSDEAVPRFIAEQE